MPIRIQRKRTKGWKMPENTVSVTRPGKWGNPFKVSGEKCNWFLFKGDEHLFTYANKDHAINESINQFEIYMSGKLSEEAKIELRGKNLACFCSLDQKCHADILLEIANQ